MNREGAKGAKQSADPSYVIASEAKQSARWGRDCFAPKNRGSQWHGGWLYAGV